MAEVDPEAGSLPQRRSWSRVPLRAKVRMEFADQRYFLSEWAVNLSPGGMFVRSESPVSPGQRFTFDAGLTSKGPRFCGTGQVLWVRREWDRAARPPGFAVQFLELEEAGRLAIVRLAEVFLADGVAAMQEELQRLAGDYQARRLNDESTDELSPADLEDEPLPDTAVIPPPFGAASEDDDTAQLEPELPGEATSRTAADPDAETPAGGIPPAAVAGALDPSVAAASAMEDFPTQPMPEEPEGPSAEAPARAAQRRTGGRGVVAALAFLVLAGGGAFFAWRYGYLPGQRSSPQQAPRRAAGVGVTPVTAGPVVAADRTAAALPASFETLRDVTWGQAEEGLWVTLAFDGLVTAEGYRHDRLPAEPPEPPREVVQIFGARQAYHVEEVAVDEPQLRRIRFGYHPAEDNELRVVFDLVSAEHAVTRVESDGNVLRVLLAVPTAAVAPSPAPPSAAAAAAAATAAPPA
jgi:uncharacterized protein (TIGR02266 family)